MFLILHSLQNKLWVGADIFGRPVHVYIHYYLFSTMYIYTHDISYLYTLHREKRKIVAFIWTHWTPLENPSKFPYSNMIVRWQHIQRTAPTLMTDDSNISSETLLTPICTTTICMSPVLLRDSRLTSMIQLVFSLTLMHATT